MLITNTFMESATHQLSATHLHTTTPHTTTTSDNERIRSIIDGFNIISMEMKDSNNPSNILWKSTNEFINLHNQSCNDTIDIKLPCSILSYKSINRCMTFSSVQLIHKFHIIQHIELYNQLIEQWNFTFGFVIPNSTNTWDNCIEASDSGVVNAQQLSGNLVINTFFYDDQQLVSNFKIRVFYV